MKFTCKACGAENEVEVQQKRAIEARWAKHKKKAKKKGGKRGRPRKLEAPSIGDLVQREDEAPKPAAAQQARQAPAQTFICSMCGTEHKEKDAMKECLKKCTEEFRRVSQPQMRSKTKI